MSNDRLIMEVLTVSFIAMELTLMCHVWHILSVVYEKEFPELVLFSAWVISFALRGITSLEHKRNFKVFQREVSRTGGENRLPWTFLSFVYSYTI